MTAMAGQRVTAADGPEVSPTREDPIARGLSEIVGGPLGQHAARIRPPYRLLTPAWIVMLVALAVFGLHWLQKSPCQDGNWGSDLRQYSSFCYTDVLALYFAERLHEGAIPYVDHPVEYPVLTGYMMGLLGLPVHEIGEGDPGFNQGRAFYNLNALVLMAFGLAAVAVTVALRRRRPWDALMFVLAPTLVLTATVNWDLLAIGLTAFFFYAWSREHPAVAGMMLGLATAAKLYPLFLAGPLLLLALRSGRVRGALTAIGTGAATWIVVNAPVIFFAYDGWAEFYRRSQNRAVDWGTFWYIGANWPPVSGSGDLGVWPFAGLANDIPRVNLVSYLLFGLACAGVAVLAFLAPRRPRLAQLSFLVVALFVLTSKVWSQQFVLWLIPLAVLARPRWGAFLFWQAAELAYFFGFYAHLMNVSGKSVMPEATYVYIAAGRWWALVILVAYVVRDIVAPQRDVVWETYGDDPDGGPFVGAGDARWITALRAQTGVRFGVLTWRLRDWATGVRARVRS